MPPVTGEVELLSRAARPSLLDVAAMPELLFSLVLANLMSAKVWDFAARVRDRILHRTGAAGLSDPDVVMDGIHDYANRKLKHESPADVVRLRGVEELGEERRRLGDEEVDYPVSLIMAGEEYREALGDTSSHEVLTRMAESGRIPDYEYATLDLSEAYPRSAKGRGRLGVMACADEAALTASLACLLGPVSLTDLVVLGSPFHYTLFVLYGASGYWFNGKREGFSASAWAEVKQDPEGLVRALRERLAIVDRTIAWRGTHFLRGNRSTMPEDDLARIYGVLWKFLGRRPAALRALDARPVVYEPTPAPPPLDTEDAAGEEAVREAVSALAEAHPRSVYALAPYTFRSLRVERPEAYIHAGLRGPRVREAAGSISSVAEACSIAKAIPSRQPVLEDPERIALPDETLLVDHAGHRDRALLVLGLLALAGRVPAEAKRGLALVLAPEASYVRVGGRLFDADTGAEADGPEPGPGAVIVEAP